MEELVKELDIAYRMISNIPVTGDAVDMMAFARSKLRRVIAELNKDDKGGDVP